jgi:hypothetical protein
MHTVKREVWFLIFFIVRPLLGTLGVSGDDVNTSISGQVMLAVMFKRNRVIP